MGKAPWAAKASGQQLATFNPVAHVLQERLQVLVLLPLDQQIQGVQDRQPRLDQGQELLVEDDKLALLDLAPPPQGKIPGKHPPRLDPVHQEPLLHETVAHLGLGVPALYLFCKVPALIRYSYEKLAHSVTNYPVAHLSLTFRSVTAL